MTPTERNEVLELVFCYGEAVAHCDVERATALVDSIRTALKPHTVLPHTVPTTPELLT